MLCCCFTRETGQPGKAAHPRYAASKSCAVFCVQRRSPLFDCGGGSDPGARQTGQRVASKTTSMSLAPNSTVRSSRPRAPSTRASRCRLPLEAPTARAMQPMCIACPQPSTRDCTTRTGSRQMAQQSSRIGSMSALSTLRAHDVGTHTTSAPVSQRKPTLPRAALSALHGTSAPRVPFSSLLFRRPNSMCVGASDIARFPSFLCACRNGQRSGCSACCPVNRGAPSLWRTTPV